jgi:hypothetical protein
MFSCKMQGHEFLAVRGNWKCLSFACLRTIRLAQSLHIFYFNDICLSHGPLSFAVMGALDGKEHAFACFTEVLR